MKTKEKSTKKNAGRPAGAKSSTIEPVYTIRPLCRACKSSDFARKAIVRDTPHYRPAYEDKPATTMRRHTRVHCRKCGAWGILIEDFNP
jgi:hypothetical protein